METNILTPEDLFSRDVQYTIPSFQRRYVWTEAEQWEPLWQDVKEAAAHYLSRETHAGTAAQGSHFLGAVVLQKQPSRMKEPAKFDVIDGQQRLITLQMLLQTAAAVLQQRGDDQARYLSVLVRNRELYPEHLLKVLPTVHDRIGFEVAMDLRSGGAAGSSIVEAARYFRRSLEAWLSEADPSAEAEQDAAARRAEALAAILQSHLNLVVIETDGADGQDDANMIFETLNARGTPLLAWDLTKNHILNAAPPDAALDLSRFDSDWWQSEIGRGRQRRTRVDRYLISWLTMRSQQHVQARTARTVFEAFRRYAAGGGEVSSAAVAADLIRVSESYRDILELDDASALGCFLRRWRTLPAGAFEPVVLWLCAELDRDDAAQAAQQQRALTVLESYFVRRLLCGVSHQRAGGNDLVSSALSLLAKLRAAGPLRAGDCLLDHFRPYFDPRQRLFWPDDERLRRSLQAEFRFYGALTRERARMVLSAIEVELRGAGAEPGAPDTVSVEQIMPRSWSAPHWPFPDGQRPDDPAANERRGFLLDTIGNLTLVTAKLNARLSNGPWPRKRAHLEGSALQINRDLLQRAPRGRWDEESIEQRSEYLAAICTQIWPEPQRIL